MSQYRGTSPSWVSNLITRVIRLESLKASFDSGGIVRPGSIPTSVFVEHHLIPAQLDMSSVSTTVPYLLVGPMPKAGVVTLIEGAAGENKTCGATSAIFDVHKILAANVDTDGQGTTIFTTQANRPTISNGHKKSSVTMPDVISFAEGDWFAFYSDQAGTNLTVVTLGMNMTMP